METITGGIGMPSAWYGSLPGNPIPHDAYTRPQGEGGCFGGRVYASSSGPNAYQGVSIPFFFEGAPSWPISRSSPSSIVCP